MGETQRRGLMFEQLAHIDSQALVALNHLFPATTDTFWLATSKWLSWLPLYAILLHRLWSFESDRSTFVIRLALIVVGVLLWDQGANFAKWFFERPRPCHTDLDLRVLAHCSPHGFFSAHAANTFGLAILVRRWVHRSWFPILLIAAFLQSFSRIHLGVHYPSDIVVGALYGILVSTILLRLTPKAQ